MPNQIAVFSAKIFEKECFERLNRDFSFEIAYFEAHLNQHSAEIAKAFPVVCAFVSDRLDRPCLEILAKGGIRLIALRSAGYNHVDLNAANELGLKVVRVPAYSPYAVAEHAIALMLALNRKTHRAYNRVREGNFALNGLMGFDMFKKTAGVIGTGKIGAIAAKILLGFGCRVLAYDLFPNEELRARGVEYLGLEAVLAQSDILTLHCPLTPNSFHLINSERLATMKKGVMIINTGRGALIDTKAMIAGLKSGHLGYLGLDVYEEEEGLFFEDHSNDILTDDCFTRLVSFPNVLITGHQAFFTREALENIVTTTLQNIQSFQAGKPLLNEVTK